MYLEFILLIIDYFKTLNRRILLFEWVLPFLITCLLLLFNCKFEISTYKVFKENSLDILGVLLGFSIAIITIITTGSGKNIDNIKTLKTRLTIDNREITLYKLILINFTYSVILEIFVIIGCLLIPLLSNIIQFNNITKHVFYSIFVFLVLHILLLTLRNLTDFYFIITKDEVPN